MIKFSESDSIYLCSISKIIPNRRQKHKYYPRSGFSCCIDITEKAKSRHNKYANTTASNSTEIDLSPFWLSLA